MGHVSRREFLEQSMLAAAAAASPCLPAFGQENKEGSASPNERLRVAVIGVHGQGAVHVSRWARMKDVEVVALCDVDPGVAPEAQADAEKKSGKKPAFVKDIRKLLDDKSIDAVSIATPNHWHTLAALWAVQAGKDVYVEKPLSHNVREGRVLMEAARKHGRIVQHGTQNRCIEGIRQAINHVKTGKLGKIKLAVGLCYKDRRSIGKKADAPVPPGVDYNLWLGPAPLRPFNPNRFHYEWHWNWDYGNGDIGNQGVHQMDVCRWGIGKSEFPKTVVGLGGRYGYEDDGQTPNTQVTLYDYGDCQILFEVRGLRTKGYKEAYIGNVFYGDEGYVVIGAGASALFTPKGDLISRFSGGVDGEFGSREHFRNFVHVVRSRKMEDLRADVLEGHLSSALCHLGNISWRLGKEQPFTAGDPFGKSEAGHEAFTRFKDHLTANKVDLEKVKCCMGRVLTLEAGKESFSGDAEADALLTRDYRKPFVVPDKA